MTLWRGLDKKKAVLSATIVIAVVVMIWYFSRKSPASHFASGAGEDASVGWDRTWISSSGGPIDEFGRCMPGTRKTKACGCADTRCPPGTSFNDYQSSAIDPLGAKACACA